MKKIPFLPFSYASLKKYIRGFYPISSRILRILPFIGKNLETEGSDINPKEYVGAMLLIFTFYFSVLFVFLTGTAYFTRPRILLDSNIRIYIVLISLSLPSIMFIYLMIMPYWNMTKKIREIEKNLLFATRHLMIQTTAGVPLFDAIVSVSENYNDERMDYGEISREFRKIVVGVRTGEELTTALEKSASRNASFYYRQVVWQLANANRAGADIGEALRNLVEYLSDEQRIMIQDYGSQLNPLALFYMITCIIAPTMGLVFLMVTSSFIELQINDFTFLVVLIGLFLTQIIFMGLIKSRRPRVAL